MTPSDQHVGVDVMINPPSLVNFHYGKITDNTQDMAARNLDVFLYISYSKIKLKTDPYIGHGLALFIGDANLWNGLFYNQLTKDLTN